MQGTFGPQFIERYMKPLLQRILTDMSEPKDENRYLQKIIIGGEGAKLKDLEREQFFSEYFRKDKTKPFSSTGDEDVKFQNQFLEDFTKFFQMRRKLSGIEGARKALMPDKEKNFNQEVSRNIFQMAYKMCLNFEKRRIEELLKKEKGEISGKDKENLDTGKLKLLIVNGVERVISEDEAKRAAADPNMKNLPVTGFFSKQIEGGGGMPGETTGPVAELESQTMPLENIVGNFAEAKAASMENVAMQNGLEVVVKFSFAPGDKEKKYAIGKVRDIAGQLLTVLIDTDADKNDPRKFRFSFEGTPPAGSKDRTGETFFLSEKDLSKFEPTPGKRNSAEDIVHPKLGALAGEKKEALSKTGLLKPGGLPIIPQIGPPKIGVAGPITPRGILIPPGPPIKIKIAGKEAPTPAIPTEGKVAEIPGGPVTEPKPEGITTGITAGTVAGVPSIKPLPTGSVMQKKQAVAKAKARAPFAATLPRGARPGPMAGYTERLAARRPQPKKRIWGKVAIIGTQVGLLGGSIWGAAAAAGSAGNNPENLAKPVVFVLHCLQMICRA